jgi:ABC-2 type transport system permease protein
VVLVMVFAAFGAWYSLLVSGESAVEVGNVWETAVAQIPAALLYLALPAAVFVTFPRATVPVGWALLALGVVLGVYGGMLGFDKWLRDLSPFTHSPVVTNTGTDWSGGFWMLGIGVALSLFAVVAVRRREVGAV